MQSMRFSLLVLALISTHAFSASPTVQVDAGEFDRDNTVITFELPPVAQKLSHAIGQDGETLHLQSEPRGKASLIIPHLPKGHRASYLLSTSGGPSADSLEVILTRIYKNKLKASASGHHLFEYQAEPGELPRPDIKPIFTRGGYIHPIYSPAGKLITDDFPPNHIHHHGVWWAWTKTEFEGRHPDFWNMGDGKGRVEFVSLDRNWSGPVHGGFIARHRFVDLTAEKPVVALNEVWEVKVYNTFDANRGWMFDLVSTQECATNHPLKLPEYRYGGIGVRSNRAWNGKGNANWLTSEGQVTKDQGMRGRWCDMSGLIDGAQAGITILSHPANFRAPQPMRVHPTEPFFCFAPQEAGDMEIAPGQRYVSRYRFLVHDGPPDKKFLEAVWNDYANPPKVTVSVD